MPGQRPRRSFNIGEKRTILREQTREGLNNSEIALRYDVTPTQIRRWRVNLPEMQQVPSTKKRVRGGRPAAFLDVEDQLYQWVVSRRGERRAVTVRATVEELKRLKPEASQRSFFNLQRWVYRFLDRRSLSLRRITRRASIPDPVLEARLVAFNEEIFEMHRENANILWINMNQTAVEYDMPARRTVDFVGVDSVQVQTSRGAGGRATVALTVCSNGEKLPVFVVFKGRTTGRIVHEFTNPENDYPQDMIYTVQENAWTDEVVVLCWITRVLRPFVESVIGTTICLVIDSYSAHRTDSVLGALQSLGVHVLFIPGGLTGYIQPLDVGVNAPFKHWIRETWSNGDPNESRSPRGKRAEIARIIHDAWGRITPETVSRSFNNLLASTNYHAGEMEGSGE